MALKSEDIKLFGGILVIVLVVGAIFVSGEMKGFHPRYVATEDCYKCHTLTVKEAAAVINSPTPAFEVRSVSNGPVNGFWEVVYQIQGKRGIAYIDFGKQFIFIGSVVNANTKEDITRKKANAMGKVDPSAIPLENAIVMGDKGARYQVVVFDDPD